MIALPQIIPPSLIPTELQPLFYLYIFPTVCVLLPIFFAVLWHFYVPAPAKEIVYNKTSKVSLLNIAFDDGSMLTKRGKVYPEGVAVTKGKEHIFLLPRTKTDNPGSNPGGEGSPLGLKRFIWKGTGSPTFMGYAGKGVLTNVLSLIGLEHAKDGALKVSQPMLNRLKSVSHAESLLKHDGIFSLRGSTKKMEVSWKEKLLTLGELVGDSFDVPIYLPVDPAVIKQHFEDMYTQSQMKGYGTRRELIGLEKGQRDWKIYILPVVAVVIVGIAAMVLLRLM